MNLILNNNDYHYALESLLRVFLPDVKINTVYDTTADSFSGDYALCDLQNNADKYILLIEFASGSFKKSKTKEFSVKEDLYKEGELYASQLLFLLLSECYNYSPKWGIQTGVRPTKIFFNLLRNNTREQAIEYLKNELFIDEKKCLLVQSVADNELDIINSSDKSRFSLYISIPFCPTRCSYCSFISHSYDSIKRLIPEYVRLLCEEIKAFSEIATQHKLALQTVYIGGGTPTILSIEHLDNIIKCIQEHFDLTELCEFTLEAGRPDTLDSEKLEYIKKSPITRLTVNAQTFKDETLVKIGRNHTSSDIYNAYKIARELGFDNINTDLIAGLPNEKVEDFIDSLNKTIALDAENITIHTLALKRSSFLITRDKVKGKTVAETEKMLNKAYEILLNNNYIPYYMYRQSKSIGNLENVGWAKKGKECKYNIFMMEEVQNVFGAGAGAVTRLIDSKSGKIFRIYNYKYPFEYISDFDEMINRKHLIENYLD